MLRFSKSLVVAILILLIFALSADSIFAQYIFVVQPKAKSEKSDKQETQAIKQPELLNQTAAQEPQADKKERKKQRQAEAEKAQAENADKAKQDDTDTGEKNLPAIKFPPVKKSLSLPTSNRKTATCLFMKATSMRRSAISVCRQTT